MKVKVAMMVTILRLSREMMILVLPVYINPTPQRSIPHYSSSTIKQKPHPTVHPCYALSTKDMKTTRNWGKDFPSYFLFAHIPYYCKCYNIACTVHCSVNSVHTHMYNNWETECTLDWLPGCNFLSFPLHANCGNCSGDDSLMWS